MIYNFKTGSMLEYYDRLSLVSITFHNDSHFFLYIGVIVFLVFL